MAIEGNVGDVSDIKNNKKALFDESGKLITSAAPRDRSTPGGFESETVLRDAYGNIIGGGPITWNNAYSSQKDYERIGDYYFSGNSAAKVVPNSRTDLVNRTLSVAGGTASPASIGVPTVAGGAITGGAIGSLLGLAGGPFGRAFGGVFGTLVGAGQAYNDAAKEAREAWRGQKVTYEVPITFHTDENGKTKATLDYSKMASGGVLSGDIVKEYQDKETTVNLNDEGVLEIGVSPIFANTNLYQTIVKNISKSYAGLSKEDADYEKTIETIKQEIDSWKNRYDWEMRSYAEYKANFDASSDAIVAGYTTELAGYIDPEKMDSYTVNIIDGDEVKEESAKKFFDSVYDMSKDERSKMLENLANIVYGEPEDGETEFSDDQKAIALGEMRALYAVSKNTEGYKDDKYQGMLDADWYVSLISSYRPLGIDISSGVRKISGGKWLNTNQEYLNQSELMQTVGILGGAATTFGISKAFLGSAGKQGILDKILKKIPGAKQLANASLEGAQGGAIAFISQHMGDTAAVTKAAKASFAFNTIKAATFAAAQSGVKTVTNDQGFLDTFLPDFATDLALTAIFQYYDVVKYQQAVSDTVTYVYKDTTTGEIKTLKKYSPEITNVETGTVSKPVAVVAGQVTRAGSRVGLEQDAEGITIFVDDKSVRLKKDGTASSSYSTVYNALKTGVVNTDAPTTAEDVASALTSAGLASADSNIYALPTKDVQSAVAAGKIAKIELTKQGTAVNKALFNRNAALDAVNDLAFSKDADRVAWRNANEVFASDVELANNIASDIKNGVYYKPTANSSVKYTLSYGKFREDFGKMKKEDFRYLNAKELIARAQLAQSEKDIDDPRDYVAEAVEKYGKYLGGVSEERAIALDEFQTVRKEYLRDYNISAKKSGYVDTKKLAWAMGSSLQENVGWVPLWRKGETYNGLLNKYYGVGSQRQTIKEWFREGELLDIDDFENPLTVDSRYQNFVAQNMGLAYKTQVAAERLKSAGLLVESDTPSVETKEKRLAAVKNKDELQQKLKDMVKAKRRELRKKVPTPSQYAKKMSTIYEKSGVPEATADLVESNWGNLSQDGQKDIVNGPLPEAWKSDRYKWLEKNINSLSKALVDNRRPENVDSIKKELAYYKQELVDVHQRDKEGYLRANLDNLNGRDYFAARKYLDSKKFKTYSANGLYRGGASEISRGDATFYTPEQWYAETYDNNIVGNSMPLNTFIYDGPNAMNLSLTSRLMEEVTNTEAYKSASKLEKNNIIAFLNRLDSGADEFSRAIYGGNTKGKHAGDAVEIPRAIKDGFRNLGIDAVEIPGYAFPGHMEQDGLSMGHQTEVIVFNDSVAMAPVKAADAIERVYNGARDAVAKAAEYNNIFGRDVDVESFINTSLIANLKSAIEQKDASMITAVMNASLMAIAPYTSLESVMKTQVDGLAGGWYKWAKKNIKAKPVWEDDLTKSVRVSKDELVRLVAEDMNQNTTDGYEMGVSQSAVGMGGRYPITWYREGKPYTRYIKYTNQTEERLAKAVTDLFSDKQLMVQRGIVSRTARALANDFRLLTTGFDPTRAIVNVSRDTTRGAITPGKDSYASPKSVLRGVVESGGYTNEQKERLNKAIDNAVKKVAGETYNSAYRTERSAQKSLMHDYLDLSGANPVTKFTYDLIHDKRAILEAPGDFFESFTRKRLARSAAANALAKAQKEGKDFNKQMEAAMVAAQFGGKEYTANFSRKGELIDALSAYVPYLSSAFAGFDGFKRAFIDDPVGVSTNYAMFLLAYMIILADTLGDEQSRKNYYRLSDYDRGNSIVLSLDNNSLLTIPLDQETASFLFPYRRVLETLNGVDPASFYEFVWGSLTEPIPFDLSGFSEDGVFNLRRGIERLASQLAPTAATGAYEALTGTNLYYGSTNEITDEYLESYGIYSPEAGDYTTKSKNSALLREIANKTGIPQWQLQVLLSNFGGNVGQYILNTLDKLSGATEDAQGGKDVLDAVFKSFVGTDSDNASNQFYSGIKELQKEKQKLLQQLANINEDEKTATGDELYKLQTQFKKAKDDFGTKVADFVSQYLNAYEITGGLSRSQAMQIYYLFRLDDDKTIYEYGSVGESYADQANQQMKNEATRLAAPVLDKYYDQVKHNIYQAADGTWKVYSPYGEQAALNTIYGEGVRHEVGLRNLIEGKNNSLKSAYNAAYNARRAAYEAKDYDTADKIGAEFDIMVVERIAPYIERYGAESVIGNSDVLEYLEDWFFVPSNYIRTKDNKYVSLAHNASTQRAFVRPYIKELFGLPTTYSSYSELENLNLPIGSSSLGGQ